MQNRTATQFHGIRGASSDYRMYGLLVRSHISLPCPREDSAEQVEMELVSAPASLAGPDALNGPRTSGRDDWFHHLSLENGETYLQWPRLGEFWISPDGRRIACRALGGGTREMFTTYLVPQAVSCALVKQGIEPLHATTAVVNSGAVAFLGNCGYGKSSLGAAFLQAGHALLTDDQLVMREDPAGSGRLLACPGPPRIKLFPRVADALLDDRHASMAMNPETTKRIVRLANHETCQVPVPLRAIYVLRPPRRHRASRRITIRRLPPRRACLDLIANTFNLIITDRARLARQFNWAANLAARVPVKSLAYPLNLSQIGEVVAAVREDCSP